jgi:hypothetical protein
VWQARPLAQECRSKQPVKEEKVFVAQEEETSLLFTEVDATALPDLAESDNGGRDRSSGANLDPSHVSRGELSAEVSAYTSTGVLL